MKREASFDRLFNVLDDLVDENVGIIREVCDIPNEAGLPEFFYYVAEACNSTAFNAQRNFAVSGGVSTDRRIAMAKAVGEAVERYCSALYEQHEFPLLSKASAPFETINPGEFALFGAQQYERPNFAYVPFTTKTPVRWTEATNLTSGTTQYVPACMVYVPYHYDEGNGEAHITMPISTGLACHCSFTEATISAICEVIERDAFTITWQAMVGVPHIRRDSLSDNNQDLIDRFERANGSVELFDISLDHGVPCVLSIFVGNAPKAPGLVFAASCALEPEDAVRKSLEELAYTHRAIVRFKATSESFVPTHDYSNVRNQNAHVRLYADRVHRHLADFLLSSRKQVDFDDLPNLSEDSPEAGLCNVMKAITARGYKILVKDLTTADIKDVGLAVVRAIIPGFHPLFMGHENRALGGVRLWTVPQSLGYEGIENKDNPAPHPYP